MASGTDSNVVLIPAVRHHQLLGQTESVQSQRLITHVPDIEPVLNVDADSRCWRKLLFSLHILLLRVCEIGNGIHVHQNLFTNIGSPTLVHQH